MSVIMEVIEKKTDYKTGAVTIKLLDTNFDTLTKFLGTDTGKDWKTFSEGDILSVDGLKSLNDEQLNNYLTKFENFIKNYNDWINDNVGKVDTLLGFSYNFTTLTDWAYKYIPNSTPASYITVLNDIAGAEKEMYDFCYYTSNRHMEGNLEKLREWSKTQSYGSTVDVYVSKTFESKGGSTSWSNFRSDTAGINVTINNLSNGDKRRIIVDGLDNINIGDTALIQVDIVYIEIQAYRATANWEITRRSLGSSQDDGYYIATNHYWTGSNQAYDQIRDEEYIDSYTGISSPHFDNIATLPFLTSRVLI